jgi:hypothetical protein
MGLRSWKTQRVSDRLWRGLRVRGGGMRHKNKKQGDKQSAMLRGHQRDSIESTRVCSEIPLFAPSARDDVGTQNRLDRPVIVHLSSKNAIHGFGLPQMRVKQDAIPGVERHYRMRGFYAIQTQADF